jgi:long-chain acyl-CoA synthetase
MYIPDKPDNTVDFLNNSAEKFPAEPFLGKRLASGDFQWISYADFKERVDNCRAGLALPGAGRGDAVGIISANSIDWAVAFFAAGGLGARYVPMYESELEKTWKYIINDADIKVLFISKREIYEKIKDILDSSPRLEKVIIIEGEGPGSMMELERLGSEKPVPAVSPEHSEIAVLIYTSGTTGEPKGVLLSHGNLTSNSHARVKAYPEFSNNDRTLNILPWAHSFGLGELLTMAQIGASIGLAGGPATIAEDIIKVKPTFLIAVPRVFNRIYDGLWTRMNEEGGIARAVFVMGVEAAKKKRILAESGESSFITNLKFAIADLIVFRKVRARMGGRLIGSMTGSAAMNPHISRFFWDIGIPLYDAYGLTETSPGVTMNIPACWRIGSVGKVQDKCRVVIDKSLTGDNSPDGEVIVYSAGVMQGYHKKPEATAAVMTPDGGFRTGDRGYLDEDGFLYIAGRLKEQYKLENGKYVFPAMLEEVITLNHYIEFAYIYGDGRAFNICIAVPDFVTLGKWAESRGLTQDPVELIKHDECIKFLEEQISETIKNSFHGYEIPRKYIFDAAPFTLDNGMLTQTLKLKRMAVLARFKDRIEECYRGTGSPLSPKGGT